MEKIRMCTNDEVEEALGELLFFTLLSTKYHLYQSYKEPFDKMLSLIYRWTDYYAEDLTLDRMSEEEIREFRSYMDEVPFDAYGGMAYFEEVVTFIDVCSYYASIPINKKFDKNKIRVKGREEIIYERK